MIRSKLGLLGLCAMALGLMAFSASAAQAEVGAKWLILMSNGEVLTGTQLPATIEGEIENKDASLLTHILGLDIKILCTAGTLVGVKLESEGSLTNGGKVQFSGCKTFEELLNAKKEVIGVDELPSCLPHSKGAAAGVVETNAGKGLIVLHKLEPSGTLDELTRIEPKEGTAFVTLEMEATCPIGEKVPVNGKLFVKDCEGLFLKHQIKHLIEQGPLTELWVLNKNAEHLMTSIDGSAIVFLGGLHTGLAWGGDPA